MSIHSRLAVPRQPQPASLKAASLFRIANIRMWPTNQPLSVACKAFVVQPCIVLPEQYVTQPDDIPTQGDFFYRAVTCVASRRLEYALWRPGAVACYDDPVLDCSPQEYVYRCTDKIDSQAISLTLLRFAGPSHEFKRYLEHLKAYRLIFVGHRFVAAGTRCSENDRARTGRMDSRDFVQVDPPSEAIDIALRAMQTARVEFAAVDAIEDQPGKLALASLDFPCCFLELQHCSDINIADAMLGHLVRKRCLVIPKRMGLNRTRRRLDQTPLQPNRSI